MVSNRVHPSSSSSETRQPERVSKPFSAMINARQIRRSKPVKKPFRVRCYLGFKNGVDRFVNSGLYGIIIAFMTFYALFAPDINVLAFDASADRVVEILMTIVFFTFVLEVFVFIWIVKDYFPMIKLFNPSERQKAREVRTWATWGNLFAMGSFYFYLDIVAAVSLIFEVRGRQGGGGWNVCVRGGVQQIEVACLGCLWW